MAKRDKSAGEESPHTEGTKPGWAFCRRGRKRYDVSMTDDTADVTERIDRVEDELDNLQKLVGALQRKINTVADGGTASELDQLDRFDRPVVERAEVHEGDPSAQQLYAWFNDAGIRDTSKIRSRIKSLRQRGYL